MVIREDHNEMCKNRAANHQILQQLDPAVSKWLYSMAEEERNKDQIWATLTSGKNDWNKDRSPPVPVFLHGDYVSFLLKCPLLGSRTTRTEDSDEMLKQ